MLETFTNRCFLFIRSSNILFIFEAGLIPMFLIIGVWGIQNEFTPHLNFSFTLLGSVLMLAAIIAIYWLTGTTDITQIYEIKIPKEYQNLLWLAFF